MGRFPLVSHKTKGSINSGSAPFLSIKSMEINIKVNEQFHYFNIDSEVDSVFGNWAVSSNGDVVNSLYPYVIWANHLNDNNWIEKMKAKVWFKAECEESLRNAINKAVEIQQAKLK